MESASVNDDPAMSFVIEIQKKCDPDPAHSDQVTALAVDLFDGLRPLHGYGASERRMLTIAGRLHDIGWGSPGIVSGKHHKLSAGMIRELAIPGLGKQERLMCALIARYHTKSLPDASRHRRFAALDAESRDVVEWLAAALRVADGLESTHTRKIKHLSCFVNEETITLNLDAAGDCRGEIERARQKEDLLVKRAERKIIYRCL
jgi:exopolyphosphatase/guanosine-5'-triphosphate,3'-diphosphate pyrophosphatase